MAWMLVGLVSVSILGACADGDADAGADIDVVDHETSTPCGDGVIDAGEECDSGPEDDAGCAACRVADGWVCTGEPSVCVPASDAGLEDVGTTDVDLRDVTDDAAADIDVDTFAECGNDLVEYGEECDDGNVYNYEDGCGPDCRIQEGWECDDDEPSNCFRLCGNGVIDEGETCDQGPYPRDGDGCSATCQVESGWGCSGVPSECVWVCGDGVIGPDEECDDGRRDNRDGCNEICEVERLWVCEGEPSVCESPCGNGVVDHVDEECDDGNAIARDGCTGCGVDTGWVCTDSPSACELRCGNGRVDSDEECDDGGRVSGDGCDSACSLEPGWECSGRRSTCERICGNGRIDEGEACDSGTVESGCTGCRVARAWECSGEPSVCTTTCGNGRLDDGEECDDGDTSSPGCLGCMVRDGWRCSGAPSVCETDCGNGTPDDGEECDDGGRADGDGCSADCRAEDGWTCDDGTCARRCGDGVLDPDEACDDGNRIDGDGCSADCALPTCGDGDRDVDEECDLGAGRDGDGCSRRCIVEEGWNCSDYECRRVGVVCGNGWLEGGGSTDDGFLPMEWCDDGNVRDRDGCSSSCRLESGWSCSGEPSVCVPSCGTVANDTACSYSFGSNDEACRPIPKPFGISCAGGEGFCDGRGGCVSGSVCNELEEGEPCDDGTGALGLRCQRGLCQPDPAYVCSDGLEIDGRCWRRARSWSYPRYAAAYDSSRMSSHSSASIEAPNPVGAGRSAPAAYVSGSGSSVSGVDGCHLHPGAHLGGCTHVCGHSSASATGDVVSETITETSESRLYRYRGRDRGPVSLSAFASSSASSGYGDPPPGATATVSGIYVSECGWGCGPFVIVDGECTSTCDDAAQCEADEWVDLRSTNDHCGSCGNACEDGFDCVDGECACRFDTDTDPQNCGACGNVCGDGAACVDGACVCPFDTRTDPQNCGACGNACPDRHTCAGGTCVCAPDVLAENPAACDGCPDGRVGRYCELECPLGLDDRPCSGPDIGVCVERDGEAVCDCFDPFPMDERTCLGGYPQCTLETSTPW